MNFYVNFYANLCANFYAKKKSHKNSHKNSYKKSHKIWSTKHRGRRSGRHACEPASPGLEAKKWLTMAPSIEFFLRSLWTYEWKVNNKLEVINKLDYKNFLKFSYLKHSLFYLLFMLARLLSSHWWQLQNASSHSCRWLWATAYGHKMSSIK